MYVTPWVWRMELMVVVAEFQGTCGGFPGLLWLNSAGKQCLAPSPHTNKQHKKEDFRAPAVKINETRRLGTSSVSFAERAAFFWPCSLASLKRRARGKPQQFRGPRRRFVGIAMQGREDRSKAKLRLGP
jgi:hypothetical protein